MPHRCFSKTISILKLVLFISICLPSMCGGQSAVCGGGDDLKGRAKSVEPSGGKLRGASGELQQTCQLFLGETGHHCPEPLHHLWIERRRKKDKNQCTDSAFLVKDKRKFSYFLSEMPGSADNHSMSFEVLHVYIACSAHQQLRRIKGKTYIITQRLFFL